MLGRKIGDYLVEERIGLGGMGVVYRGVQSAIGKQVAIKVLRPDGDPRQLERLTTEARSVTLIRHRGIVDVFGMGTLPDGRHYLVMELLVGEGLDALLRRGGAMPWVEAWAYLDEILNALGAAHLVGITHRDLKPSNVFVVTQPNGTRYVKLLDFGLAKQGALLTGSTPPTRASLIVGTPLYMAPEQASGERISAQTDLYSLGVLAFEMLTGSPPFRAPTALALCMKHLHEAPPSASSRGAKLPPGVDALLAKLLEKSPEERPRSAESVRHLLAGLHPTGAPKRLEMSLPPLRHTLESLAAQGGPTRRRIGVRGMLAVSLALLVLGGSYGLATHGKFFRDHRLASAPVAVSPPAVAPPLPVPVPLREASEVDPTTLEARIALMSQTLRTAPLSDGQRMLASELLHQTEADLGGTPDDPTLQRVSSRLDEIERRFLTP